MHNLELKVRCTDEAHLDRLITTARAAGAIYTRTLMQRDTYFAAPRGRLKLREWHQPAPPGDTAVAATDAEAGISGATLIAYARPDDAGSRLSDYLLSAVSDPASLRAALERALGLRIVVEKHRLLYLWGHTRIHFDRVTALGAFVELETLLDRFGTPDKGGDPGAAGQRAAEAEHQAVMAALGLAALPAIAGSYSDLLVQAPRP
ncbi:MAG TPA: class IV adenylate cyclase [Thermomicrobiales bacterium]|jgi:adenylate cyclase class IV